MFWLAICFTSLLLIFLLLLQSKWEKMESIKRSNAQKGFTIIIPARNEETCILQCMRALEKQSHPQSLFEVIVVDDFSNDNTVEQVLRFAEKSILSLKVVKLVDQARQGKKHAITQGVEQAAYPFILTTDADCWMEPNWISSYSEYFQDDIHLVAGPVSLQGDGLFANIQQIEFGGLMALGAVSISRKSATVCSGANLAFRKQSFHEIGGYTNNLFTPSGDDEFLLHNITQKYPGSAIFLKDPKAMVYTAVHHSLHQFINQRIRWTSKWKFNRNALVRLGSVLFFLEHLLVLIVLLMGLLHAIPVLWAGGFLLGRWILQGVALRKIHGFFGHQRVWIPLLVSQVLYPIHVLVMGLTSIFGSYTWKGRTYQ